MAAKIKLQRVGTKNRPYFRVVVQEESAAPVSNVIAILGQYYPMNSENKLVVNQDEALAWIKKGAKPTEKVRILFGKAGLMAPVDLASLNKRKPKGAAEEKPADAQPTKAA